MDQQTEKGTGYLVVQVTTANSAVPLSGAHVVISADLPGDGDVIYDLRTGSGGRTERVALETLPRAMSETPGDMKPYLTYHIEVSAPGYEKAIYQNVPIFDGITAFQQANLIPAPENGFPGSFTRNGPNIYQNEENQL